MSGPWHSNDIKIGPDGTLAMSIRAMRALGLALPLVEGDQGEKRKKSRNDDGDVEMLLDMPTLMQYGLATETETLQQIREHMHRLLENIKPVNDTPAPGGPPEILGPTAASAKPPSSSNGPASEMYTRAEVEAMLTEIRTQALRPEVPRTATYSTSQMSGPTAPWVASSNTSTLPRVRLPRDIPAVKAKPAAAPKTVALPRRTSVLPAFTRLRRAELEVLAHKWCIDMNGLNMNQIHDRLFALDATLTEQAATRQENR